jgi:predicted metal-dependent hydrolase
MAIKQLEVEGVGVVRFQKRRGTRSVRLHIQGHQVQVTLPHWISYQEAIRFVKSRADWIREHRTDKQIVAHGSLIGKQFQLFIEQENVEKPKTRVLDKVVRVILPKNMTVESDEAQLVIQKACERALTKEAKELLTPRIHDLAYEYGFAYNSLQFKKLKRRWGSCDQQKHIILNIYLTQLPWDYIDYVLLHELTHTEHLHHGADFWEKLQSVKPNAKQIRKAMKDYHPQLLPH